MGSRDGGVRAFPRGCLRRHRRRNIPVRRRGRQTLDPRVRGAVTKAVLLPALHLPPRRAPRGVRRVRLTARRRHHRDRAVAAQHLPRLAQRTRRRHRVPVRRTRTDHVQNSSPLQRRVAGAARAPTRGRRRVRGLSRRGRGHRHHRDAGEHPGRRCGMRRRVGVRGGQGWTRVSHAVAHGAAGFARVFRRADGVVAGNSRVLLTVRG